MEIWVFVLVCIIVKCMEVGEDRGEVGCEKGIVVFLVKVSGEKKRLHVVMWSIICLIIMLSFDCLGGFNFWVVSTKSIEKNF